MIKLKIYAQFSNCTAQDHKQLFSKDNLGLALELFFEMTESVFWLDEEVV